MIYSSTIKLGTTTLYVSDISITKVPYTNKAITGRVLIRNPSNKNQLDYEITLTGDVFTRAQRDRLRDLNDSTSVIYYIDNLHNGTYYVETIQFNGDDSSSASVDKYSIKLVSQ